MRVQARAPVQSSHLELKLGHTSHSPAFSL